VPSPILLAAYMNTSGIVEERADYILQQAKWHQEQSLETQGST
jgi:hypothetical protein